MKASERTVRMRFLPAFLLLLPARSADSGVAPALPVLARVDLEALKAGRAIHRHEREDGGRVSGLSAVVARAAPEEVWRHVLDFDAYASFLPYVTSSRTVDRSEEADGPKIVAALELTTLRIVTRYRMEHRPHVEEGWCSWTLVPERGNPLRGATGSWQISPFDGDPGRTLLVYRADVTMGWWIPDFLQVRAAERGLPVLVDLVRRRAEGRR
ncbi:MAG: SRPBCC family protein [Deltaproteobacteria bacterium]|nr:SRPBCC family protein [Deltaproteobacteria bacterium]